MKYIISAVAVIILAMAAPACTIAEDDDNYGWQTGVYAEKSNAEGEKKKLEKKRMIVDIYEKQVEGETMYAVVVGRYSTEAEAMKSRPVVELICDCEVMLYEK
jgi:septal ring-binding cell division protein DamX